MSNPINAMAKAVTEIVGDRWRINQYVYLDEELGFVYFSAPVAANIRTTGSLQKGVAAARGGQFNIPNLQKISNREAGLIANPKKAGFDVFNQMLEDKSVIKLAFVRDPAERFAAVYRNLLSINTKFGQQRVKLLEHLGMPIEENLSMLDLAELLCEEAALKDLLPQFVPQRRMLAFDLVAYDFIGRHETWEEDYANIAMEIFGCETPIFDPVKDLNSDPEGARLPANIDEETRAALEEAYAEDYDMLDELEALFPDGFAPEEL